MVSDLTNHIAASAFVEWFMGQLDKEKINMSQQDKDKLEGLIFHNFEKFSNPAVAALKAGRGKDVIKVVSEVVARVIWLEFKEYYRKKGD